MVAAESFLNVVPRWGFGLMVLPMGSCSCGAGEKQVSAPEKSTVPLMPQWPGRPCAMLSPEVYPMAWTAGTFYCCDAALHPKLLKNNNFSSTESPNQVTNNCNESTPCTNTTPPQLLSPCTFKVSPFWKGSSSFSVVWKLYRATDSMLQGTSGALGLAAPRHGAVGPGAGAAGRQEAALMSPCHRSKAAVW